MCICFDVYNRTLYYVLTTSTTSITFDAAFPFLRYLFSKVNFQWPSKNFFLQEKKTIDSQSQQFYSMAPSIFFLKDKCVLAVH